MSRALNGYFLQMRALLYVFLSNHENPAMSKLDIAG